MSFASDWLVFPALLAILLTSLAGVLDETYHDVDNIDRARNRAAEAAGLYVERQAVGRELDKGSPGDPARLSREIWAFVRDGLGMEKAA